MSKRKQKLNSSTVNLTGPSPKSSSPTMKSISHTLKSSSPPLISNWIKKHSKSRGGRLYFYNVVTGVSTWTKPDELIKEEIRMKALDSFSKQNPNSLKRQAIQQNSTPKKKQKLQNDLSKKQSIITSCESNTKKSTISICESNTPQSTKSNCETNLQRKISTRAVDAQPQPNLVAAKSCPDVQNRKKIKPSRKYYKNKSCLLQDESKYDAPVTSVDRSGTFNLIENLSNTNRRAVNLPIKASKESNTSKKQQRKNACHNKQGIGVTIPNNISKSEDSPQADILPLTSYCTRDQDSKNINELEGADISAVQKGEVSLGHFNLAPIPSCCHSDDMCDVSTAKVKNKRCQACARNQIGNLAKRNPQSVHISTSNQSCGDHRHSGTPKNSSPFQHTPKLQVSPTSCGPPTISQRHNVKIHASIPQQTACEQNKILTSDTVSDDHFKSVNNPNSISRLDQTAIHHPPGHFDSNFRDSQQTKSSIDSFQPNKTSACKNVHDSKDSVEPNLVSQSQDTIEAIPVYSTYHEGSNSLADTTGENFIDDDFMDVDEEEIFCNLQDVRNETSKILEQPSGTLTEMVFNSNNKLSQSSVRDSISSSPTQAVIFVIDTNVLISNLQFFENLFTRTIPGYGTPTLVLPWAVMQELDYLKNGRNSEKNSSIAKKAAAAVRLIHTHLSAQSSQLVGQTPHEASEPTNLPFHSNDDRILQCCLQCEKKYLSSMVVLVTRDINLINKAIIMGIMASSTENFWTHFKVLRLKFMEKSKVVPIAGALDKSKELKTVAQENKIQSTVDKCQLASTPASDAKTDGVQRNTLLKQDTLVNSSPIQCPHAAVTTSDLKKYEDDNDISDSIKMEESQEIPGNDSATFNKFQAVWSVIFEVRSQLTEILSQGKLHENYSLAVDMLNTMLPLLQSLRHDFERCFSLSPVVLTDHKLEFASLASLLNTFFERAKLSTPDPSQAVNTEQLINHFKQGKNRPMLLTGLEQLTEFIDNYQDMSKVSSLGKCL